MDAETEPPLQDKQNSLHSSLGDKPPSRRSVGDKIVRLPSRGLLNTYHLATFRHSGGYFIFALPMADGIFD